MTTRLLIAGGYGAVGAHLSRELAAYHDIELIVAGRRPERAAALAVEIGAAHRGLDLRDPSTWEDAVKQVDGVVMCMDLASPDFVGFVFARGIDYIDVTAEDALHRAIAMLPLPPRSAAMLSVGLAPGLTNLFAADAAAHLDSVRSVEIGILTGLGDVHGAAGIAWTARKMFDPAEPRGSETLDFGPPWGRRRAHRVGFSDQYALAQTLGLPVTTRLAFESRFATAATFSLARRFGGNAGMRAATTKAFGLLRLGSRSIALSVTASGTLRGADATVTHRFRGEIETLTTARLAALQIRAFLAQRPPPGVWHSHEILDAPGQFAAIERAGFGEIELGLPIRAEGAAVPALSRHSA